MPLSNSAAATIRLGIVTLIAAAAASAWELLALQAPGSPLNIGMLPGPIAALGELCTVLGLLQLGAGVLLALVSPAQEPRASSALLHVGTLLAVAAQVYGAALGMSGVQLIDLRPDALPLFIARQGGLAVVLLALLAIARSVLRQLRSREAPLVASARRVAHKAPAAAPAADRSSPARQLDPEGRGH